MSNEFIMLGATAASVAAIHTLAGPDHYLPFIAISQARKWNLRKTIWFTILCGLGHVGSSVLLGFAGIALGIGIEKLNLIEGVRGSIITYVFTAFGLVYMIWGLRRAFKKRSHLHHLPHDHQHENKGMVKLTPWILFTIFIFGPCEPLIPIVMYPAARHNYLALIVITGIFCFITLSVMLTLVIAAQLGFKWIPMKKVEHYSHAFAGGTVFACGLGMLLLGW